VYVLHTDFHVYLQFPPRYMLVENVVGFEASPMCAVLRKAMATINLDMQARCLSQSLGPHCKIVRLVHIRQVATDGFSLYV
jgi:hypothetical protein